MKRFLPVLVLLNLLFPVLSAQQFTETAETLFYDADFWYTEEEDFEEAAYLFRQILREEPDNANVKFLLAMCYLNTRGLEEDAIPLFLKATEDITLKYREHRYGIKQAPHHSWFYLADAYRRINDLDKALEALDQFSGLMDFEQHYNVRITDDARKKIERAKIIRDAELNLRALYFKEPINTTGEDYSGVISADGNMMVWVSSKTFYEAVFMATRDSANNWSFPIEIATQIVSDGNLFPTGLSADGTTLLLKREDDREGNDIWYSQYDGMFWSPAQPVHGKINSKANEQHASFSPDGNRIYFSSDRRGGEGGFDIWYSDRMADGQWGEPKNLGKTINTAENETSAYMAPVGNRFIFASEGHFNMGGFDIFHCELQEDGSWGAPTNIGYPINTTGNDTYYVPLNNGLNGLYSRYTKIAVGGTDLWYMEIQGEEGFIADGLVLGVDTREKISNKDFAIIVVDEESGEEIEILYDAANDSFKALGGPDKKFKVVPYKQK